MPTAPEARPWRRWLSLPTAVAFILGLLVASLIPIALPAREPSARETVDALTEQLTWVAKADVSELGGFPHENLLVVRYWVLSPTNAERLEPFLCDWYAAKRPLNVELQFSVYLMDDSEAFHVGPELDVPCGTSTKPSSP